MLKLAEQHARRLDLAPAVGFLEAIAHRQLEHQLTIPDRGWPFDKIGKLAPHRPGGLLLERLRCCRTHAGEYLLPRRRRRCPRCGPGLSQPCSSDGETLRRG